MAIDNAPVAGASRGAERWLRADIDGIRAVAVILVVAFHAGLIGFDGGFVGVDVFYVISGFLITSNLLREVDRSGRIDIREFWARRIRRLAPALILVVLVTLAASALILSPMEMRSVAATGVASALYVSNIVFAQQATNYFAHDLDTNPFLHTWSLGVEEQFYVLWPLIFMAAVFVARRHPKRLRHVLLGGFALTFIGSFGLSLYLTDIGSSWAFYSLPTRAWEFAGAGLFAMVKLPRGFGSSAWGVMATFCGGILLVLATVLFTAATPFPGIAALVPVIGTLLLIAGGSHWSGDRVPWQARPFALRPVRWLGAVSYSWYLWHWPMIVLAVVLFHSQSSAVRVPAAVLALAAGAVTYRYVEDPLRHSERLRVSKRLTYAAAASCALLACVASAGLWAIGEARQRAEPTASLLAIAEQVPDQVCEADETTVSDIPLCVGGDLTSDTTVMVVGDSHAGQWKNAFFALGDDEGYRIVVRWKSNCPATGVYVVNTSFVTDPECGTFQQQTMQAIDEVDPDAVVVAGASGYLGRIRGDDGSLLSSTEQQDQWRMKFEAFSNTVLAEHPLGLILDNPRMPTDPMLCLSRLNASEKACRATRAEGLGELQPIRSVEADIASDLGLPTYDPSGDLCGPDWCDVQQKGIYVYVDRSHLSNDWTTQRSSDLKKLVESTIR